MQSKILEVFMFMKRFALLVLSVGVISCFQAAEASAAQEEASNQNTVAVSEANETITPVQNNLSAIVPTAAPVAQNAQEAQTAVDSQIQQRAVAQEKKAAKKKKHSTKKKKKASYTKKELRLMASIINCEAGAEPYQGKLAVGVVVMNRIKSRSFPNTLKKVIYQKYQFSPVRNGSLNKRLRQYDAGKIHSKQWKDCISAAKKTLEGQKTIVVKGKVKNMKSYHFFSVRLSGARMKLGGHRFK